MKHTKSPWQSVYDDNGFYFVIGEGMPSPYIVATANEGDADEANAKLIAAAPDMLEVLHKVIHAIQHSNMKGTILHAEITAAIKKATK